MHYATGISMMKGKEDSNSLVEIEQIYVEGFSWQTKAYYYDYLASHPGTIAVGISPYPKIIKQLSVNNEKFVKSEPNKNGNDNLLSLPRY